VTGGPVRRVAVAAAGRAVGAGRPVLVERAGYRVVGADQVQREGGKPAGDQVVELLAELTPLFFRGPDAGLGRSRPRFGGQGPGVGGLRGRCQFPRSAGLLTARSCEPQRDDDHDKGRHAEQYSGYGYRAH
jgi:hypothetical protein